MTNEVKVNPEDVIATEGGVQIDVFALNGDLLSSFGAAGTNRVVGSEVRDGLLMVGTVYLRDGVLRTETSVFTLTSLSGWSIDEVTSVPTEADQGA